MVKVNNRNTRTRCEICLKLTIKTPEQRRRFDVGSSVSIVNFEQVNAGLAKTRNDLQINFNSDILTYSYSELKKSIFQTYLANYSNTM